jgi:beta-lactamase superfamily II metal-dependent hydrolase
MKTAYVKAASEYIRDANTNKTRGKLIFGDELKVIKEDAATGRHLVRFRSVEGLMDKESVGPGRSLEIYFIDVGQGDATFIVTPGGRTVLVDGGKNDKALAFLAWKYRLDEPGNRLGIDLVVLSHADGDHIKGLVKVVGHPRIDVKKVIHSGIARYEEGFTTGLGNTKGSGGDRVLVSRHSSTGDLDGQALDTDDFEDWIAAIKAEGAEYEAVDSGTGMCPLGDPSVQMEILGPRLVKHGGKPAFKWFSSASKTINGNSVVFRLTCGSVSALFPGDVNKPGGRHLLGDPHIKDTLASHVFKAPHHGSKDFSRTFYRAVRPQVTIVSSGEKNTHGHPRAEFLGYVGKASRTENPLLFSTHIAADFPIGEADTTLLEEKASELDDMDFNTDEANRIARLLQLRRIHGMINVRTDGERIYAARRVPAGYKWELYSQAPDV